MVLDYTQNYRSILCTLIILFMIASCKNDKNSEIIKMTVTASAYNSVEEQTKKGNPNLTAWGDILEPGEKAIAVSRDLIKKGLGHLQEVKIEGLSGTYIVKDKMNKRWTNKIDIYMGLDKEAALEWGKQEVDITFISNKTDKD